jgi:predicted MPP superfamily phosphohydrolase
VHHIFGETTRRSFLKTAAFSGFALTVGCLPRKVLRKIHGYAGKKLRIVFYTDVHSRTEWETPLALRQAADTINAQEADLVIAGGDLITEGFQSSAITVEPRWQLYMKMHRAINAPIYPVIGNHDLVAAIPEDGTSPSDNPRKNFLKTFDLNQTYRSFNSCGYHMILLDSICITGDSFKYQGMVSEEQLEWLKEDLSKLSNDTPCILATHIPLLTSFYQVIQGSTVLVPKNRVIVNNREVLSLFRDRNLVLVLQGHLHVKEMVEFRSTTFITGGAICAKWWRGPWYGTEEGFCVITLNDNSLEWEYIDYGWEARRPPNQ